jgi:ABC-type multidrug transport system ATPase subunit
MVQLSISSNQLGKRFNRKVVFKDLSFSVSTGKTTIINGSNGSGKSTLLKILMGYVPQTKGEIVYQIENKCCNSRQFLLHCWWVSPELQLPGDFTLTSFIAYYSRFRNMENNPEFYADTLKLPLKKKLQDFSSGMLQKLKLGTGFLGGYSALFLDEPTSFLDIKNIEWYTKQLSAFSDNGMILLASNRPEEYKMLVNYDTINLND